MPPAVLQSDESQVYNWLVRYSVGRIREFPAVEPPLTSLEFVCPSVIWSFFPLAHMQSQLTLGWCQQRVTFCRRGHDGLLFPPSFILSKLSVFFSLHYFNAPTFQNSRSIPHVEYIDLLPQDHSPYSAYIYCYCARGHLEQKLLFEPTSRMSDTSNALPCFVCERMRLRKPFHKETGLVQHCVLCQRDYCESHKSTGHAGVCEINHRTYYQKHPNIQGIYATFEAWEKVKGLGKKDVGTEDSVLEPQTDEEVGLKLPEEIERV